MLAAGALRAVGVDPDLVPVELDLDVVVDLGQDLDQRERRLAPLLRVERADPHEPMDAALGAQPAVGAPAVDLDGHALEAGLLALLLVDDLGREAMALRPAQVHPQEHLGPVGRLGAAGAGADGQDRGALVVLAGEQERGALAREVGLERRGVAVQLGVELGVGRLVEQLDGGLEVVGTRQRGPARWRSRRAGRRPRAGPSGRRAGRPRSRAPGSARRARRRAPAWPRGQRRPEVARIRSARSRMADAST